MQKFMTTIGLIILCISLFITGIIKTQIIEFEKDPVAHYPLDGDARNGVIDDNHGIEIIEGHTDNIGTFEYNMQLSVDRAEAVVDYLLKKGLDKDRVRYEGFGYSRPLSISRDEAGRKLNRRVAFRVYRKSN